MPQHRVGDRGPNDDDEPSQYEPSQYEPSQSCPDADAEQVTGEGDGAG